jgi:hypothetical protein
MVDFNAFVAELNEEYGTNDDDWDKIQDAKIITFDYDDRGKISGRYKGLFVYRDKNYENVMSPGETWICTLDLNPQTNGNYFAKPLKRIDASFVFELKKDQIGEIAEFIWDKQRDQIEPLMKEKYMQTISTQIAKVIEETKSEYEAQIKEMSQKTQDLEFNEMLNLKIINSLHKEIEDLRVSLQNKPSTSDQTEHKIVQQMSGMGFSLDVSVRRGGPDSIVSEFFDKSRYFIHLSADYRTMIIVPHEEGNVVCIKNEIILVGLNMVSPFSEACDMISKYNPIYGGVQIYLK